ncbi:uncharacterized protein LOC105828627 isoform X2 [Monomorium pharaonis]|uniref:uncharacterized protein LOC105828627 isoform X2 n=1 Tax=Monomorium pharaonis TaxID=307658 RepID=UPI00102E1CFC|nr:uncharacterized protein LOC105828627 isoform X2 [Monomorium pharaonis]
MAKSRDKHDRESDYTGQTTMWFFKDQDQRDIDMEVGQTTSRNKAWDNSLLSTYTCQLFAISPTTRITTPVPPNAPIKPRKLFSKEGLKPKKLRFTDKDKNEVKNENCFKKSTNFSIEMSKEELSKQQSESKGILERENLSFMLQSIRLELDNKENRQYGQERYERRARNNRFIVKEHARNNNNSSQSSKLNCSSKDFNKCPVTLLPCKTTWSKVEKLLQFQRDTGMWIQCCRKNCNKWRYCDDFHDPVDVPKIWYCEMNSNKALASCFVPQVPNTKEVEEDLIENKYNAGSLVWGHVDGYPWWPAIVDDCPETLQFYELQESSIIPVKYHVTFFEDNIQCAWLNVKNIKAFTKYKKSTLVKENKFYKANYKKSLEKAYALAQSTISLSIIERLQRFSCISRLKLHAKICDSINEEQDDEIPIIPTKLNQSYCVKKVLF